MKIPAATFQRLVQGAIKDLPNANGYIDGLVTVRETWEARLKAVEKLLQCLSEAKLTVNLTKSEFGQSQVVYLRHVIGQGEVAPTDAKVQSILAFHPPSSKKALRGFLGMAGCYRIFYRN